jgi:hypothetical protein
VEDFTDGVYAIPRPGNGKGGFVIDTEEKWSFYWSMRRLIGLENIEMIFDNITVMVFPVFASAPVCEKEFIRVKNTVQSDITIGELYQKCAAEIVDYYSVHSLDIVNSYGLLDARAIMESRPENIWIRHKKSLESFLRLMQQLIMMSEYRPEPTLDNPLMILLLMMHAGVIIAVWEGKKDYALGKNLNTFTSEHDNTNMESYTSVSAEDIEKWVLLQVFYPNVEAMLTIVFADRH